MVALEEASDDRSMRPGWPRSTEGTGSAGLSGVTVDAEFSYEGGPLGSFSERQAQVDKEAHQAHLNPLASVRSWQASASAEEDSGGERGIVARLALASIDLFTLLLQHVPPSCSMSRRIKRSLRRSLATLRLWADGHDLASGRLDNILDRSLGLRNTLLTTLCSLASLLSKKLMKLVIPASPDLSLLLSQETNIHAILDQTKWILSEHEDGDDYSTESGSSDSDEEKSDLDSTVELIKTYIQCLVDLNSALESPAMDPEHDTDRPTMPRPEKHAAQDYFADLIIAKYPKANSDIVSCLGKVNWERYRRVQAERHDNINAAAALQAAADSKSTVSGFQDSGLGTSIPAESSAYAATIISFISSMSGGKGVQIPPLSAEAKAGQLFECIGCGKSIRATNNREWRKHLFKDLLPYNCILPDCRFNTISFLDRELWSTHLELEHGLGPEWKSITCPLCIEETGDGRGSILIHLARHMEDISLVALPRGPEDEPDNDTASNPTNLSSESPISSHLSRQDISGEDNEKSGIVTEVLQTKSTDVTQPVASENIYFLPGYRISRPVLLKEIRYYCGPSATARPYNYQGRDGFLITTPGPPLSEAQVESLKQASQAYEEKLARQVDKADVFVNRPIPLEEYAINSTRMSVSKSSDAHDDSPELFSMVSQHGASHEHPLENAETATAEGKIPTASTREIRACVQCHYRRIRCDAAKPRCGSCVRSGNDCDYNRMRIKGQPSLQSPSHIPQYDLPAALPQFENSDGNIPLTQQQRHDMLALMANDTSAASPNSGNRPDDQQRGHKELTADGQIAIDGALNGHPVEIVRDTDGKVLAISVESSHGAAPSSIHDNIARPLPDPPVKCICGHREDDGNTVFCEKCSTWQHIACYYPDHSVPDVHECTDCLPRNVNVKGAAHQKTHQQRSERPHKCSSCGENFLYQKDKKRHERTHDQSASSQVLLYCDVPGCTNTDGFSRRDNLRRHQRKQHPILDVA